MTVSRLSMYAFRSLTRRTTTGDVYVLTLLDSLLPTITHPPAEYDTAVRRTLDHPCTQQDIADFVTEFLYSDVSVPHSLVRDSHA